MTHMEPAVNDYFLTTERLGFRWWRDDDTALAQSLWGDPDVTRLFASLAWSEEQVRARFESELANGAALGYQYWPVFLLDGGEFIGCCGMRPTDYHNADYEFGYHLRPAFWGRGLATEAARAAVDHAFGALGGGRIFAGHHPENHASGRVLMKLGFTYIGLGFFEPTGLMHPGYILDNPAREPAGPQGVVDSATDDTPAGAI